jgi:general secretion pathway protein D
MNKPIYLSVILIALLSGCVSNPSNHQLTTGESFLKHKKNTPSNVDDIENNTEQKTALPHSKQSVDYIAPMAYKKEINSMDNTFSQQFSKTDRVKISADELPLNEFIHYVMGDLLQVSYILGAEVKEDNTTITLNLQNSVSQHKLYALVEELLAERQYMLRFNDGIYYVNKEGQKTNKGNVAFGYGNKIKDVPSTSQPIWQMAPFDYGFNGSLQLTLSQLAQVEVYPDSKQNLLLLKGKRTEIIKALEFMQLVDKPKLAQRQIALYKSTFVDIQSLIKRLSALLQQEGISVGAENDTNRAISIVPLENMGALTLFANKRAIIQRAIFWLNTIDQPQEGDNLQYFIYAPQFSRATDLGLSLDALLGGSQSAASSTSADATNKSAKKSITSSGITGGNVGLVVDERANSLIFQTTGEEYRKLLPLIKRLDVMPKQILLEVVIAEVKLTDEYKQGVDLALTNQGIGNVTGGFNLTNGDGGLSYILTGAQGSIDVSLFQKNTNVEVLSRPSLLVRDGVTATMSVGDNIPTVGEIITDPVNGSRTSIVYLETGVDLSVTPTINAQGVVIMEIVQKISNQAPGDSSVAGSPTIFERTFSTEVVADSGQTIILGGLISEDKTINDRTVPFFSSLPLIGKLFDATEQNTTKTELVIMVTPRLIESTQEWSEIKNKLSQQLEYLKLPVSD